MRCSPGFSVDGTKYQIQVPLPPKIVPSVTMAQVKEKPKVTYSDVGGCQEQVERVTEVVGLLLLQPERFVNLSIDPPKGVLLYGPPGTGKTRCARAVANQTDTTFMRAIGSELVQKHAGQGARMVRELFESARHALVFSMKWMPSVEQALMTVRVVTTKFSKQCWR